MEEENSSYMELKGGITTMAIAAGRFRPEEKVNT